jgi:hypothetical protein
MNTRPKTLLYADALAAVESRVVEALPAIIDGLIARAKDGDLKAAVYLCDRIMGRAAAAALAPANDRTLPYTEEDFAVELRERESKYTVQRLIAGLGASNGA